MADQTAALGVELLQAAREVDHPSAVARVGVVGADRLRELAGRQLADHEPRRAVDYDELVPALVVVLSTFPPMVSTYGADLKTRSESLLNMGEQLYDLAGEMAVQGSIAWIVCSCGNVVRFNLFTHEQLGPRIPTGRSPRDIAVSDDSVWVPSEKDGTVTRIDLKTARVVGRPIPVPNINGEVAVDPVSDDVWLSGARDLVRIRG